MKKTLLFCSLVAGFAINAQVTGAKTIGIDYPTLVDAFADLNANGVGTGGATINIPAGYTETTPVGGYILGNAILNATLSVSNPLIITKSGTGDNPVFTAYTGTSATVDAFFNLAGVDYVTINGITLQETAANTTATTRMERGFSAYNLSATDGPQYNTIQNCVINFLPGHDVVSQTTGINFAHTNVAGTAITPSSAAGLSSYNKIYGNSINNALSSAITLGGYASTTPFTLRDTNNDIGGSSAATGNTFNNIGELAYVTSYGVFGTYQAATNVSYNTMNFAAGGLGEAGIYIYGDNTSFTVNNNTVNAAGRLGYYTSSSSSTHAGIYCLSVNASTTVNLTANNNIFNMEQVSMYSGSSVPSVYGILHAFAATANLGSLTAFNNDIKGVSVGSFFGIYDTTTPTSGLDIADNKIHDITTSSSVSASIAYGTYLSATSGTRNILRNNIYNLTSNGATGSAYGVYVAANTANGIVNIANNLIGNLNTPSVSSANVSLAGIYFAAATITSNYNVYYNSIYLNGTSTGANFNSTGIYQTYANSATISLLDLRNNIIVNNSTPNGTGTATALRRSAATNLSNYATTSNNNDFAVGSTGFIYYDGTTKYNFANFQTLVTARESASLNVTPVFKSTDGSNADFLKILDTDLSAQSLDNHGSPITGYTTDFAGTVRDTTTPDLGAYEFKYNNGTLGVALNNKVSLSVYPNPFVDVLKISDVKDVKSISVSDLSGRMVKTLAPTSELNLSNLQAGMYIVTLQMKDGSVKSFKTLKK